MMTVFNITFVIVCLCSFAAQVLSTLDTSGEIHLKQTSLVSELKDLPLFGDSAHSSSNSSTICSKTQKCNNGGSCIDNVCICLPGTTGPYCNEILGCSALNCGNDKNANCSYDQKNFKAFCFCKQERYQFDYEDSTCKMCDCEQCELGKMCFSSVKRCEFVYGQKKCTCISSDYKFNPKSGRCESCSVYGDKISCDFDQTGKMVFECKKDFQPKGSFCDECKCGFFGSCKFRGYDKVCNCDKGYSDRAGTCERCDCGNGKCEYDWNYRKTNCICDPGYYEEAGKCQEVKSCYCGENATCKYENKIKKCDCPQGYQEINGMCADVNECDNPNTCHSSMTCINNDGGYECVCKAGFQKSKKDSEKCEDINECLRETACPDVKTICLNTLGSYTCYCKPDYATRVDENTHVVCESKSGWKLGYGLLIGFFIVTIGILMFMIHKYR